MCVSLLCKTKLIKTATRKPFKPSEITPNEKTPLLTPRWGPHSSNNLQEKARYYFPEQMSLPTTVSSLLIRFRRSIFVIFLLQLANTQILYNEGIRLLMNIQYAILTYFVFSQNFLGLFSFQLLQLGIIFLCNSVA
jgi:hypothetical protein